MCPHRRIYEGAETIEDVKSPAAVVSDTVKATAPRLSDAYDTTRKPGMPLSILSNIAREAPLGSLLVAFLLGVAVARRLSKQKTARRRLFIRSAN
jgi:hypothetical protein